MYSTYSFSSMLFMYLPFSISRDEDALCVWNLPLFSIFLSYKCKLVTIAYWTIFNNTINTRWSRTLLSFFRFPSFSRRDVRQAHPILLHDFPQLRRRRRRRRPSSLFPFSPIIFLSLSLYIPVVMTVPFRCAVCYLPFCVLIRFFLAFS